MDTKRKLRRIILGSVTLGIAVCGGIKGYESIVNQQRMGQLSALMLENIEALAENESSHCNNVNGYREWSPNHHFLGGGLKNFYDCCYVLHEGYSPSGNCRNY